MDNAWSIEDAPSVGILLLDYCEELQHDPMFKDVQTQVSVRDQQNGTAIVWGAITGPPEVVSEFARRVNAYVREAIQDGVGKYRGASEA